jgi:nicotinate-nucleotide pyrophosphorylase (carboxylating)
VSRPARFPPETAWRPLLERSLAEDLGSGDVTSSLVVPSDRLGAARIEARSLLVICGLPLAAAVFRAVDSEIQFKACCQEGERSDAGETIARVEGPLVGLLAAERTALNFLYRLCGIATLTRRYVEAVAGTGVAIVDTRKTMPGWRTLDKYAVQVGGGVNHRAGLYDAILIKDNHIAAVGGVTPAVKAARAAAPPHLWIQVEVESEDQAEAALAAGADSLLLDNRSLEELRELARRFRDRCVLEASGGITLETVRSVAATGVHRISVGALTHSAPGADLALEIQGAAARP